MCQLKLCTHKLAFPKFLYYTTNSGKKVEAIQVLKKIYQLDFDFPANPIPAPEIQASTCADVAAFTAKYLADKYNGLYIDIDDFLQSCSLYWKTPSLEGLLFYCEVVLNLLFPKKSYATYDDEGRRLRNMVATNISVILNKTGYGFSRGEDGIITIHKKDALAASVIEDMDDKATAKVILEYNRFNLKGDL